MNDLGPFWLSIRVASLATLLIVAVGLPAALVLAQARFPGKALVAGILVLPLVLPPTVLGYYLLQILGRRSLVGHWLEQTLGVTLVFHWSGAVVASAVAAFPVVPAAGAGRSRRSTPRSRTRPGCWVAASSPCSCAVTLPLAWRGLAAGIVLAFARRWATSARP